MKIMFIRNIFMRKCLYEIKCDSRKNDELFFSGRAAALNTHLLEVVILFATFVNCYT